MLHLLTALLLLRNWRPAKSSVLLPAAEKEREREGGRESEVTAAVGEPVGEYL